MPMQLYFKSAKCFVQPSDNDRGTKKFLAQPANGPQAVPFWVAETPTFKRGIEDGSIVNLTPPHLMPGYVYPKPEEVEPEPEPEPETGVQAAEDDGLNDQGEQANMPKQPFGGQPMTPVPPAAKVGNVSAGGKKSSGRGTERV